MTRRITLLLAALMLTLSVGCETTIPHITEGMTMTQVKQEMASAYPPAIFTAFETDSSLNITEQIYRQFHGSAWLYIGVKYNRDEVVTDVAYVAY